MVFGIDDILDIQWRYLSLLSASHVPLAQMQAAMETQAAQWLLLENFKEPVLGYFNPHRAAWSNLTCNVSKGGN